MDHLISIAIGVLIYLTIVLIVRRTRKGRPEAGEYLIGQRVVVDGEIVIVCKPDLQGRDYIVPDDAVWVRMQSGTVTWYFACNVEPLPNGQV